MRIGVSTRTLGLAIVAAATAQAASAGDWTVTVGARLQISPPYEGAGYEEVYPVPTFAMRRAGQPERLAAPDDGYGISLLRTGWFTFGPTLRLRGSRDDKGERAGLHTIGTTAEPGLFVNMSPTDWLRLHAEERRGVFGHHGWVGDAGLDFMAERGRWSGSIGPRIGWGDHSYMEEYFAVTAAEAAASPVIHTVYQPNSGARYAGAMATLAYQFKPRWQAAANFGYHRLVGDAAASPIVKAFNARDEYIGGVGVKYSFDWMH